MYFFEFVAQIDFNQQLIFHELQKNSRPSTENQIAFFKI